MNKTNAFTLAEVLITLLIIGIIATMTLPAIIQNYQMEALVTSMKKNYSVLANAFMLAVYKHGNIDSWELKQDAYSAQKIADNIKPYLKIIDDCGTSKCEKYSVGQATYLNNTKNEMFNFQKSHYYKLRLADGTALFISGTNVECLNNTECIDIYFDKNGAKAPNTLGKDIFYFGVASNGHIAITGQGKSPADTNLGWKSCNPKVGEGWYCTAWVYYKKNQDYLKCAEKLTWSGKNSCKN